MKVNDVSLRGTEQEPNVRKPRPGSPEALDFQELLKDELSGPKDSRSSLEKSDAQGPPAFVHAAPHLFLSLAPEAKGECEATRSALDALTNMVQGLSELERNLSNPSISPRGIQEHLQGIEKQLSGIEVELAGLPGDHPLRAIGEEMSILAHVESVKWNRGDYL